MKALARLKILAIAAENDEDRPRTFNGEGGEGEEDNGLPWLKYPHLNGYFHGVKAIVPLANHTPEFPHPDAIGAYDSAPPVYYSRPPAQTTFSPYPDYASEEYLHRHHPVVECFLDRDGKVAVPDLYAHSGVPQYMPDPAFGSHRLLGLRDDICFDRWGRYGPYGLGYSLAVGGTGEGLDTERFGSDAVWRKSGRVDYGWVNWGDAQTRCFEANKHRFESESESLFMSPSSDLRLRRSTATHSRSSGNDGAVGDSKQQINRTESSSSESTSSPPRKHLLPRTAIIIRSYVGFQWTQHSILNFRALISELALKSSGEYAVHFLLHVKDEERPIWSDPTVAQAILDANVPTEFHSLCTLWSEAEMRLYYPGHYEEAVDNPSGQDFHGVYRSAHFALQVFATKHPEYAHFWNWEMDMRYVGSYYELFDRLDRWTEEQTRHMLWERSAKYYIPSVHGGWENFSAIVADAVEKSERPPILGPVVFAGRASLMSEESGVPALPSSCSGDPQADPKTCGVGEPADLITLNPIFDAEDSGWVFERDITGYPAVFAPPPRRSSIVTACRLSRRLLAAMHEETWRLKHGMFSEMWPATVALHRGLKAVYAPHPVYLDRAWVPLEDVDRAFNGGRDGSTSGPGSPFDIMNEHFHKGSTWYYNSEFAGLLWRRWLGYAQMDGRGPGGGTNGEGTLRGGLDEEQHPHSSGRMCLRSMLVHPIKWEKPDEKKDE